MNNSPAIPMSAIPTSPTRLGNLPTTSSGMSSTMSASQPYGGFTPAPAGKGITFNASGMVKMEKEESVTVSDEAATGAAANSDDKKNMKQYSDGAGYAWVVWVFLIFIIIVLIIMAIFWYTRPEWATCTDENTGQLLFNTYHAGAYAFGIAIFFIIIIVAIWCCACR